MRRVIYLIEQPLDKRNFDRFGIQAWIDKGWEVEIWDLTAIAYPQVWRKFIESGGQLKEFGGYFPIALQSQLDHRISAQRQFGHFIDLTGDHLCSIRTKRRLIQMGATRVVCATGTIPVPGNSQKRSVVSKLKNAITSGPIQTFKWLANAIIRKLAASSIEPGLVIVSGETSIPSYPVGHDQKILRAHNLDYDIYLNLTKSVSAASIEYAVFVDQDYCFHPDFIFQSIPFLATPQKYFPSICHGLKSIAVALKVAPLVAAHPRSSYQQRIPDYFEGIPVVRSETAELIKNCKVVVCHNSTAIQFAVLFAKPLIFITTDELNSSYAGESISCFASELGKTVINVDRNLDKVNWNNELSVNLQIYSNYRNKYIKIDGTPEVPHWDIVIDHIEKEKGVRRASADLPDQCAPAGGGG